MSAVRKAVKVKIRTGQVVDVPLKNLTPDPHQPRKAFDDGKLQALADNLAAIAATLDAMRSIERHGGAEILDRAFTGFTALPAPEQPWQVLGVAMDATRDQATEAWRRLAIKHHPDRGGEAAEMSRVNVARDAMLERCSA